MFNLVSAETTKRRVLYLLDAAIPLRFFRGRRSLKSVLSHHEAVAERFAAAYHARYAVVRDWFTSEYSGVNIVDLRQCAQRFGG